MNYKQQARQQRKQIRSLIRKYKPDYLDYEEQLFLEHPELFRSSTTR